MTSARYTTDFNETKDYGSATSTVRTADQTAIAYFWNANAVNQLNATLRGVGSALFDALIARFKDKGVTRVRTLVDRKDHPILSFFRAQGMVAGPSLQLDRDLS